MVQASYFAHLIPKEEGDDHATVRTRLAGVCQNICDTLSQAKISVFLAQAYDGRNAILLIRKRESRVVLSERICSHKTKAHIFPLRITKM